MSTATAVSLEEYLHTAYRPDCEWIDGELRERNLGQFDHARLQTTLGAILRMNRQKWRILPLVEQRLRVSPTRYRVPDVMVLPEDYDRSPVVAVPPLLCIEVLSPEDTLRDLVERAKDYLTLGTPECWIFEPTTRQAYVYSAKGLHESPPDATLRCGNVEISLPELFSQL